VKSSAREVLFALMVRPDANAAQTSGRAVIIDCVPVSVTDRPENRGNPKLRGFQIDESQTRRRAMFQNQARKKGDKGSYEGAVRRLTEVEC